MALGTVIGTYKTRGCEGSVDIEEADGVLELALGERRVGSGHRCCVDVCMYLDR